MEIGQHANHPGGLRGLLDSLWRMHARDETAVLGVVIGTEGSTYQKTGALVLLDGKGLRHGVISGGCLEPALEQAARDVHMNGRASLADFDTRSDEDLLFGSGIGCRGRVQLLLLPLPPKAPLARALFAVLDQGVSVRLALATTGNELGAGHATFAAKSIMLQSGLHWDAHGFASEESVTTTLDLEITSPPRLLLLGAGPETPPLALFARRLGWFVSVLEHRGRWAAFARGAPIDNLIELAPEAAAANLADELADAIIAMSHNYTIDLAYLRLAARSAAGYVGLLGPLARRDALLAELDADAMNSLKPRLHAPVGLDLGGHGPEAIALAIVAELQQHFTRVHA